VTPPPQPDLIVSFDPPSHTTIAAGGSMAIDYWLVNFGKGAAAASTSGIYISTDATITTSDTLLMTVAGGALTANATAGYYDHQVINLNLPGNLAPGTYYLGGIADYTNGVTESNESNNNYSVTQITVTAASSGAIALNGAAMAAAETPAIAASSDNPGAVTATNPPVASTVDVANPTAVEENHGLEVDWLNQMRMGQSRADAFAFKASSGNGAIMNSNPAVDATKMDTPAFASVQSLFTAFHQDVTAGIVADHKDAQHNVASVDLHQYLMDFHLV
jgi:hypothetical protein